MSDKLAELYVEITAKTDKLQASLAQVEKDTGKMSGAFGTAAIAIGNFAAQAASKILSELGGAIQKVTIDAANMADELLDTAFATGLSTDELQIFTLAAKMEGKSIDTVSSIFKFYSKAMEAANQVNEKGEIVVNETTEAFDALGIKLSELQTMSTAQQMDTLFKAINGVANENDRATIAMKLFGRAGMESLDFINTYVTEGARIEEIAKKFGIPKEQLESAAELKKTMGELQFIFDNLAVKFGSQLIPALIKLEPMLIGIAEKMSAWLSDPTNLESLSTLIEGIGKIIDTILGVISALSKFGAATKDFYDQGGLFGIGVKSENYRPGGSYELKSGKMGSMDEWLKENVPELIGSPTAFASGGIVTSPQLAMVGESGPEAIIPLGQGFGGSVNIHVGNFMGDEMSLREFSRTIKRIVEEENKRSEYTPNRSEYYSVGGHL